jgi:hypothetical protein
METKTAQAARLFKSGDRKAALAIAKTWKLGLTKEERGALSLAYECMVHPDFYRQIGTDIPKAIEEGCDLFARKFVES